MNLVQVWGALVIFVVCPFLGGLPLIGWIVRTLVGRQLTELGTGNVSVSAAFYHGGNLAGILAVLSEASKGVAAVILARTFFPAEPAWELIALVALVMGRYWMSKGAGTTNVIWGFVVHDWRVALLVFIIGGVGFTILRERQLGRLGVLVLFPLITALLHPEDSAEIGAAIALAVLLGWIYQKIPDDLDLPTHAGQSEAQPVFRFFRGDKAIISLDAQIDVRKVGKKAATLSHLKRLGYPVPTGWVLPAGDDPEPLIKCLQPSARTPLVVRSSAIGEDSEVASAAGQYETVLNVTSREELQQAIIRCQASYDDPSALQYRRDRQLSEEAMAVLIQIQVQGVFSGVAFSRDPIASLQPDAVVIEALPGDATRVVSGQVTPEQYRVLVMDRDLAATSAPGQLNWILPEGLELAVEGEGDLPPALIQQVAFLARHLEREYHGVPQDIEWSYDGRYLWLLQSRPITTLLPIWTRKIAAEVIPGLIRPLTWSINRPLTCGVWGDVFTVVLGDQLQEEGVSAELDFDGTATLHYSHAYFNASLLGQIFRRMGLPPESLEFLTRGAKFSKPPLRSTLQNVPGLLRLLKRELRLEKDFKRDYQHVFAPNLNQLTPHPELRTPNSLLERIDTILELLQRATYYSIMTPLSVALRQAVLQVKDTELDNSETPEVASLRAIASLAARTHQQFPQLAEAISQGGFERLAQTGGRQVLAEFDELIERYGYLSEVGTDIAVPTWREDPQPVRELFVQFLAMAVAVGGVEPPRRRGRRGKKGGWVQRRVDLKGRVTEVYSQLLAELRWCFVGIEQVWLQSGVLAESGDIFFLEFEEIRRVVAGSDSMLLGQLVQRRRSQFEQDSQLDTVPPLVYGNTPPHPLTPLLTPNSELRTPNSKLLQGIGASPGQFEGRVRVLRSLQSAPEIDRDTILVVPYTDSGWAPLLARVGGLIAEVGGRLSHGAIVAREYGIPAVMDIHNATRLLQDGQRVRIDGQKGTVEII